ncbi:MAG: hypothetical protein Q8Q39_02435 [bacterium]|nr:hypothetical protein [bacterium]
MATALLVFGFYDHFIRDPLNHIAVENNSVTVDAGDYDVKFSYSGDFQETYMIFGGQYYSDENMINPIWLSGLRLTDAKAMYARYPDFYQCKSAGAPVAQQLVTDLNLIPANVGALDELQEAIEAADENLRNNGDRVCVALAGKTLVMQSAEVPGKNIDIKDQLQPRSFRSVHSSQRINCKDILEK